MLSKLLFQREFHDFRMKTFDSNDEVVFAVIGGDFNVDNISPGKFIEIPLISVRLETLLNFFYCKKITGDAPTRDHILFNDFIDYPMLNPGQDKPWSIGTEHRQLRMYDDELTCPDKMRKMMMDNVLRRHFIIDADVKASRTNQNDFFTISKKYFCMNLGTNNRFDVLWTKA